MNVAMPFVGLFVGLCVGLTGVGGSSLTAPILLLLFGVPPVTTVGTDLVYSVPTKLLGAWVHWRQGTTSARAVKALCTGGFPGVILGVAIFYWMTKHLNMVVLQTLVKHMVGVALLLSAVAMLTTPFVKPRLRAAADKAAEEMPWSGALRVRLAAIGFLVGLTISLTSIGGGSLTLPLLYFAGTQLGLKRLIGSEVAFAAMILPVAALGHLSLGNVNYLTCALLLVGSIPGVFIGSRLASRVPDAYVRPAVAGILVLAGSRLF